MSILNRFKSQTSVNQAQYIDIIAPLSGELIHIEDVPDVIFSEEIIGNGVAVKPNDDVLVAPISGKIYKIFETEHSLIIESDKGVQLLVHFGVDTVSLKGRGFKKMVEEGDYVEVGTPLIQLDLSYLIAEARSVLTPVIIMNSDDFSEIVKLTGKIEAGKTPIMRLKLAS